MPDLLGAGFRAGGVEGRGPPRGMQSLLGHGRDELVSSVDLVPSLLVLWGKKNLFVVCQVGIRGKEDRGRPAYLGRKLSRGRNGAFMSLFGSRATSQRILQG